MAITAKHKMSATKLDEADKDEDVLQARISVTVT